MIEESQVVCNLVSVSQVIFISSSNLVPSTLLSSCSFQQIMQLDVSFFFGSTHLHSLMFFLEWSISIVLSMSWLLLLWNEKTHSVDIYVYLCRRKPYGLQSCFCEPCYFHFIFRSGVIYSTQLMFISENHVTTCFFFRKHTHLHLVDVLPGLKYSIVLSMPHLPSLLPIFQVYRLHQLNRAAQLVTALTFSVRATEATKQNLAIMNSLGALLTVLQILGVICVWSLSSFLMRFLPSSDIPDPWLVAAATAHTLVKTISLPTVNLFTWSELTCLQRLPLV
jgi:hypothetical protein